MYQYAIALGSNKGDRLSNLQQALELLQQDPLISVQAVSPWISNPAVGGPPGMGDFLNGAAIIETGLGPHQVLIRLQRTEHALGRTRTVHWGPRTIDLDLIMRSDGLCIDSAVLQLPHPGLAERDFVLEPFGGDCRLMIGMNKYRIDKSQFDTALPRLYWMFYF